MSQQPLSSVSVKPAVARSSSAVPTLLFVHGGEQRELVLMPVPFRIGRKTGKDLEIPDPRISRDHAEIVCENGDYFVVDTGSKLGTYVNNERVQDRRKLAQNDRIEFGTGVGAHVVFSPLAERSIVAREFLSQLPALSVDDKANDLEKLKFFLEAARKLNTSDALDEILLTLIGTTLNLTGAERGFVYVRGDDGALTLGAACTAKGERLTSDATISHSILGDAANSASEFMITDTLKAGELAARQSIVAHDLRTVIAIPLRKAHGHQAANGGGDVLGVLYLDSKIASSKISGVSNDILRVVAREAAALVESTRLAQAEEEGRRYQQEMTIAAAIQQRLMTVTIPELPFASLHAKNLPCRDIGGDFYDVVHDEQGLTVVLTDVSGKGISAAIMASIVQGMIYSQVVAQVPLQDVVSSVNRFMCERVRGEKYATALILRVTPIGEMTFVNCGHIQPVLVRNGKSERLVDANLPIGLLSDAAYASSARRLEPGDRLVLVTDGVTEAEDASGEFFGEERLEQAATAVPDACFDHIFASIKKFCGNVPLSDDCTLVELIYRGQAKNVTSADVKMSTSV